MRTSIRDFNIVLWISLILCVLLLLGNPLPPAAVVLVALIILLNLTILCWLFFYGWIFGKCSISARRSGWQL